MESRFRGVEYIFDDSETALRYRRHIVAKARSIGKEVFDGGYVPFKELECALIDCLQVIPEWDFNLFNDTYHDGDFFTLLSKNRHSSKFIFQTLVNLHDAEITILKKGYHWKGFWQKMDEIKKEQDAEKLIKRNLFIRNCKLAVQSYGWHCAIAMTLIAAILGNILGINFHSAFFMLLRFCVASAFGLWAWKAHEEKSSTWRNAFMLLALLYNPFLPVELGNPAVWSVINTVTLAVVIASALVLVKNPAAKSRTSLPRKDQPAKPSRDKGNTKPTKNTAANNTVQTIKLELEKLRNLLDTDYAKKHLESVNPILFKKANWLVQAELENHDANTLLKIVNIKSSIIRELRMASQTETFTVPLLDGGGSMRIAPTAEFCKELFREYVFRPDKQAENRSRKGSGL